MVEHRLAKARVAGSNPVSRSIFSNPALGLRLGQRAKGAPPPKTDSLSPLMPSEYGSACLLSVIYGILKATELYEMGQLSCY